MISRDFVSRYRTLPAASWEDDLTPAAFAFLAPSDKDSAYAVICPMHNHPEPELLLVMDGTLSVRREGEHCFQTARAGDFLSFAAYEAHETAMRENDRVRAVSICFDPSLLIHPLSDVSRRLAEGVSCAALYPEPRIAAEDPGCDVLRRCFTAMRDALDAPGACRETAFLSALYELFARFEEYGYLRSSDTPADA
ncbi:MAG: cupin domain-containing protein, partial [Clostridia bacterium]|nr:cupin domain-containing protein [Clostridia bacterium]